MSNASLTTNELARLVRDIDPTALLVPPRILRRVIKKHRGLGGLGLHVPHAGCYPIDRGNLLRIARLGELGLDDPAALADTVLLLPRPEVQLRDLPGGEVLRVVWQRLFHGAVDRVLAGREWSAAELQQRIERIGRVSFEEARAVLDQENHLFKPADDREVYREFVAVYLELRHFEPHRLGQFFPTILDTASVDTVLAEDVDATALLAQTRLPGAVGPELPPPVSETVPIEQDAGTTSGPPGALRLRAEDAARRGNCVRSAILLYKALRSGAPPTQAGSLRGAARGEIEQLVSRLGRALQFPHGERNDWARCLLALLEPASKGFWPVEARLLYDLQKICVDNERDIFAVDLVEWFVSLLRRPIKRHLPDQPLVLTVKNLRSALERLSAARIGAEERQRLHELLTSALHVAEERLRQRLRPRLVDALDTVGLVPGNVAERHARDKLVEELLDRVVERRFLTIGDLRDALARNRLKLPDLTEGVAPLAACRGVAGKLLWLGRYLVPGAAAVVLVVLGWVGLRMRKGEPIDLTELPSTEALVAMGLVGLLLFLVLHVLLLRAREFLGGDPLIRCNRRLAEDLDGIYHCGEIYLRWLQRFTSLFFGNPVGRVLTLYLLLPLLGSFFIIRGSNEMFEMVHKAPEAINNLLDKVRPAPKFEDVVELGDEDLYALLFEPDHTIPDLPEIKIPELDGISYVLLALFILPLLHWPAFRRAVLVVLHVIWLMIRGLLYDLPAGVLRLPVVRLVLQSRPYLLCYQYLGKPLACTLPVTLVLWLAGLKLTWTLVISAGVLVLASVLINTRLGLVAEEAAADWMVRTWQLIRDDLLPGLFRWIIYIFNRFKDGVERMIYRVDEWLRFRTGDSKLSFVTKLVLGLVWFFITYIIRFVFNVMFEPTVNPVKHFPTVTVTAKLLLPFYIPLTEFFARAFFFLPEWLALAIGNLPVHWIPGAAGFLAWELKENWRLYRANASPTLCPEVVGSHGERVIRLLRPGFHSGTLPKLYVKLRRASGSSERKKEEGLHHVEQRLRHFGQRDFIDVLASSRSWNLSASLALGEVWLGTNRIRVELCCPALAGASVLIDFDHLGGWLVASIARAGWLDSLSAPQRAAFASALTGLYKRAGVDLVWQHLEAVLPRGAVIDVRHDGLFVWQDAERTRGVVYDLEQPDEAPRVVGPGGLDVPGHSRDVLFSAWPVTWAAWVEWWEYDQAGKPCEPLVPGVVLLPAV
jgi:hypothetical protein